MNSRNFAPVWARSSSVAGGSSGFGSTRFFLRVPYPRVAGLIGLRNFCYIWWPHRWDWQEPRMFTGALVYQSPFRSLGPNACVLISGGIARQDWLPGGLMTPF